MSSHWCAVCGGAPDRKIFDQVNCLPRCEVCAAAGRGFDDWNPRTRGTAPVQPDGNAMRSHGTPAWDEWVRISESWGYP
jgi:hypothetical protein